MSAGMPFRGIHATAIVDPAARLDAGVSVGPYTVIGANVEIGAGTWIGPHVVLQGPMRIGRDNQIFQFASLGEISQDKSSKWDDATSVEIGDGNTIRENVTINRGTLKDKGVTRVGSNNWIMANCHIAHDCQVGSNTIFANNASLAGHVTIGDWVILGGYTLVHQFCRLGPHAFTGYGSGISRDVCPFVIVDGQPARPRSINAVGLKRRGFADADIEQIKEAYKVIYLSGQVMADVKSRLGELAQGSPHVRQMLEFIEGSRRALQR